MGTPLFSQSAFKAFRRLRGLSLRLLLVSVAIAAPFSERNVSAITTVLLGKEKVHPNRIVARFSKKSKIGVQSSGFRRAGLNVRDLSELVPGLVVIEGKKVALKNSSPISILNNASETLLKRIETLRSSGLFEYVEPDYLQRIHLEPTDASFVDDTLWSIRNTGESGGVSGADIDVVRAWDLATGSRSVIVAVIDTGVRYTHRDLMEQMWRNLDEIPGNGIDDDEDGFVDNLYGVNAVHNNGDPFDENDHGTHVAGTIGAAANDGNPHVGVVWNVQLMACKFLDGEGFGFTSDAIRCIDFAVKNGARILNASWGGGPFSRSLSDSISMAAAEGVLFVTSSGNDGNDNDMFPTYPASFQIENVISVAAFDRRDRFALFSNYGRHSVDIGAPGVEIFSSTATSDLSYSTMKGTSMAAAHVSGVAALVLGNREDASLSELRARLLSTSIPVQDLDGRVRTAGRVSAYRAVTAVPDGTLETSFTPFQGSELRAGDIVSVNLTVTDVVGITNALVRVRYEEINQEAVFRNDGLSGDAIPNDAGYSFRLQVPEVKGSITLLIEIIAPGKETRTQTVRYEVLAPPLNDDFENAAIVPPLGGDFLSNNKLATLQPGEPLHAGVSSRSVSVWWSWVPSRSGSAIVDTAGSEFDTVVGVYVNGSLRELREVVSADDVGGGLQSFVEFDAVAGATYSIVVAGYSRSDFGAIRLRIELGGGRDMSPPILSIRSPLSGVTITNANSDRVIIFGTASDPLPNRSGVAEVLLQMNGAIAKPAFGTMNWSSTNVLEIGENTVKVIATDFSGNISPPNVLTILYRPLRASNDLFRNSVELIGRHGETIVDSEGASKEFGESLHAGVEGGKSVWWHYRPSSDGVLELITEGSSFDTTLAVYTGNRVTNLTFIASNDNSEQGDEYSQVVQAVEAFQVYRIAVDGRSGTAGVVRLAYSFEPQAVHFLSIGSSSGGNVSPNTGLFAHNSFVEISAEPAKGFVFDRWEGFIQSHENPMQVHMVTDVSISAVFLPKEFTDGFETGNLERLMWTHEGESPWNVQQKHFFSGIAAAQSGLVSDGQQSSLILVANSFAGRGSFEVKVSSEPTWDFLEFLINGSRVERWSGEVSWELFEFDVDSGTNRFEWRYSKDIGGISIGLDSAIIDDLNLPLFSAVSAIPPRLNLHVRPNQAVEIDLQGQPNRVYVIETTTDLFDWKPVFTNSTPLGSFRFIDSQSIQNPSMFYRALTP